MPATCNPNTSRESYAIVKRAFDVTVAVLGLLLLSPLFVVIALFIRATSRGPVFFLQERVGRGFRNFKIIKFRTMVSDAEAMGRSLTVGQDPRITRGGRLLRRTKVDELPQLVNVLRGDMSLVGPRPEIPRYVNMFREDYEEILQVRPGITDMASITFLDEAALLGQAKAPEDEYVKNVLPQKIALAKRYVARRSLCLDLLLIAATLRRLVWRRGVRKSADDRQAGGC